MRHPTLLLLAAALAGCSVFRGSPETPEPGADRARAELRDQQGRRVGDVSLQDTPHGVLISASLSGLPSGTRAMHVHAVGRCDPPFESAGPHLNPRSRQHGFRNPAGPHAGDLPNVHISRDGTTRLDLFLRDVSLRRDRRLLDDDGAALVVHEFADDYATDPAGNAGARIACGVIER
jgi:Cu-Zn family superoxide dismutase